MEVKNEAENPVSARTVLKIPLNIGAAVLIAALVIIISLSIAVAVLASKIGSGADEKEKFVPVVNTRVYDFYDDGDTVLLDDSYYGEIWLPAFRDVPKHPYNYDGLKLEDGRYTYSENDVIISKTGIDVSYHQGQIDWESVAADGIDFAMLRVGYRGYEIGALNTDTQFHNYINGALDAGLDVGVYFFSQALNTEEAVEEANFVMEQIQRYDVTLPVVFDWEIAESDTARTNEAAPYTVTECAAAFCDTIADGGYTPMIYGNLKFSLFKLDMSKLSDYGFWYAEYKNGYNEPEYPYDFQIWQYASDGRVNGIDGDVDLNIWFDGYGKADENLT